MKADKARATQADTATVSVTRPGGTPLQTLARKAKASPSTAALGALQRRADARAGSLMPVQRVVGAGLEPGTRVRDGTGRRGRIVVSDNNATDSYSVEFEGSDGPVTVARTDLDLDVDAGAGAVAEPQIVEDHPPPDDVEFHKTPLKQGVFTGSIETGPNRNWADLHVTGEIGQPANPDDLKAYFEDLYRLMLGHHKFSGVPGVLEWHPTGAVVTKQIVELLGASLGGWYHWAQGLAAQKMRKAAAQKSGVDRNNLAGKMDRDIVPEHMHFLKSLRGTKGLEIGYKGGPISQENQDILRDPEQNKQLTDEQINAMMTPDMLGDTEGAKTALEAYEGVLMDDQNPVGPSLIIILDYRRLPSLIKKL
ncbi:hypothetical protein KX928_07935 [Roseobacter sp. YSTF-M11]|uniref:Uncharacterized protein n=1 Tax=Roseobacter insulae TaxID=2859783 RepID=A0A9X1K008_9RHOB|nr:hypothetical protein [Roseobacter insulae]MBW4707714.1 hypothetical protein [Roseobacter insulae]